MTYKVITKLTTAILDSAN